jgi:lambda family phage portal protein
MNLLDKIIRRVRQAAGFGRARRGAAGSYAAGRPRPGQKYWRADASGPNAEIQRSLQYLRDRSRQMVRDNPYAARAVAVTVAHQIGAGITARINNADVQARWDEWATRCDHEGMTDLYGLMEIAARIVVEGGEALIRLRVVSPAEARRRRLPIPLTLQVMEGDMLPLSTTYLAPPMRVDQGVEFNADGTRAAYHLRKHHPGEATGLNGVALNDLERVPADQIIHLFRALRPGQVRGVPAFAPVLLRMKVLDDYEDATLEKAKAESLLGVFISGPEPIDPPDLPGGGKEDVPSFELFPGMVHNLPGGSEPKFLTPGGAGGFEPFALHQLMSIAAGLHVTYDQITGDLRQANYSSLRAGKIEFRRKIEQDQWLMFIPRMCQPIWDAWEGLAELAGHLPEAGVAVEWQPPRFEMIDPLKEITAAQEAVRSGFETWDQVVSSFGYDPEKQAAEIQRANSRFDARGIVLDIDPRRVAASGSAHDARQLAARELAAEDAAPGQN